MAISKWIKGSVAILSMVALAALTAMSPVAAQDIYKTVDESGNTVYTDQKPSDDAQPVKLKELTVVDPVELGDEQAVSGDGEESETGDSAPDFGLRIVTPSAQESVWNTAYVLTVQVQSERELPAGTRLAYLVDGEVRTSTRAQSVEIEEVYRGEHQLSVELRGSDGRVLGSAGPITFFMRQHSRLHPNPG
ncbi:MAG TPA: DUF4124 domain-containing protein [Wenzhouxiangellaceae bacterium]|nr:DUF4124 domain-containing protein [Wenzhouxiangellaceae bacterium]